MPHESNNNKNSDAVFRSILVPIDGSENSFRAATLATDISKRYGAELVVIRAVDLHQSLSFLGIIGPPTQEVVNDVIEAAKNEASPWFDRVKKEADSSGVKMRSEIISAPLTLVGEIVHYAESNDISLIVVGSKGRTGLKKLLLGSVASGLVTYAPCPVLVTK